MQFEPVIGLEVHAQLKTRTKIFCGCSTEFGKPPNANTCPVCTGMPGMLPVLNRKAVTFAIKAALATNCKINQESRFDRKNYFYPDLPKGYQISQYAAPIAEHGYLEIKTKTTGNQKISDPCQICIFIVSWYAATSLLRTPTSSLKLMSALATEATTELISFLPLIRSSIEALDST